MDLPTVEIVEDAFYWIKPAYGDEAGRWTVARWQVGAFWDARGKETRPSTICGPIAAPADVGSDHV